jgi:hypothetical protein
LGRARRQPAPNARKQPIQERSRETVAVILEAAARVLEKDGLEGYNTNAVARIAKFERELLEAVRSAAANADGKDLYQSLQLIVRAHLGVHRRRAPRASYKRLLQRC